MLSQRLRKCVYEEIIRTFKAYIGEPPLFAVTFRRYAVAMSVKRDEKMLSSMLSLSVLPNGDWTNHSETQCYLPVGVPFVEKELAEMFAAQMSETLVPSHFKLMSKDTMFTFGKVASKANGL